MEVKMNKIEILGAKETLYKEHLDNGLDIYMVPNNNVKNFYLTLSVKYGSIYNKFKIGTKNYDMPKGIAHYLEHLMFNMPDRNAFDYFGDLGSPVNAFTSFDTTCYEVFANDKFKENLSYLIKYVYTPYFTKELVNNERGIITEEVKMYEDMPATSLYYDSLKSVLVNDERRFLISGTVEDVKKITLDDIETVYNAFYHPENMFLIITGNFNPEEAVAIVEDAMSNFEFPEYKKPELKSPDEPFKVTSEYSKIKANIDKSKVAISIKYPKSSFKSLKLSDVTLKLYFNLIMLLNFGNTSILKDELTSNGILTDDISFSLLQTEDYFIETIMASTYYPDYFIKRVKDTLDNPVLKEEDLQRKKKLCISNLIMMFDDIEIVNAEIAKDLLDNGEYLNDIYTIYKHLNYDDLIRVSDKMNKYVYSVNILVPEEEN